MKALTVWQPWAQLLAKGTKNNETRSWGTKYRGRILIHAAKVIYKDLPLGAIIGQANLVDCIRIDQEYCNWLKKWNPGEYAFGNYTPGRYIWVMKEAELFDKAIPIVRSVDRQFISKTDI